LPRRCRCAIRLATARDPKCNGQAGEVGYLLDRAGGAKIEAAFLRSIVQQTLTIDFELAGYERMAELVEVYADFPLGTTDAAVVAVAERLDIALEIIAVKVRGLGFACLPSAAGTAGW
jgi:hypothetical protein